MQTCRAALNFASDREAQSFMQILNDKIRQKQEKKQGASSIISLGNTLNWSVHVEKNYFYIYTYFSTVSPSNEFRGGDAQLEEH